MALVSDKYIKSCVPSPVNRRCTTEFDQQRNDIEEVITPRYAAFSPRPTTTSQLDERCKSKMFVNEIIKQQRKANTTIYPLNAYQTWTDAGNMDPYIPKGRRDPNYNANVWRHFSPEQITTSDSVVNSTPGSFGAVTSTMAQQHPIHIPPPSRMAGATFTKFLSLGNVYRDRRLMKRGVEIAAKQLKETKRLQLMTDTKVPPVNVKRGFVSPREFRRCQAQGRIVHFPNAGYDTYATNDRCHHSTGLRLPDRPIQSHHIKNRSRVMWNTTYKFDVPRYKHLAEKARISMVARHEALKPRPNSPVDPITSHDWMLSH